MILPFGDRRRRIDATAWLPETAVVIGDVVIGPESSLWFHTVVRGDVHDVRIGARTNVQDNAPISEDTRDGLPPLRKVLR
jgi:carbonic anhydrase/acetyltransferase-like protein (isoleucine patch superfamily)